MSLPLPWAPKQATHKNAQCRTQLLQGTELCCQVLPAVMEDYLGTLTIVRLSKFELIKSPTKAVLWDKSELPGQRPGTGLKRELESRMACVTRAQRGRSTME